jgi:hypothetical protein
MFKAKDKTPEVTEPEVQAEEIILNDVEPEVAEVTPNTKGPAWFYDENSVGQLCLDGVCPKGFTDAPKVKNADS